MIFCANGFAATDGWRTALPDGDGSDVWLDKQTVEVDPAREAWKMELGAAAWKQVDALSPECREILTAFHRDEKSYEEIAGQIRAKLGTVGSRLSRCLEHLRKLLRDPPISGNFFPAAAHRPVGTTT
jgi:RNA polymerase sigma factor (sigma-70 family)